MARRASLTFDAVKASKGTTPAQEAPEPVAPATTAEPGDGKRGRGRPRTRPADERIFGMTLRIPGELRRSLRRAAEEETDDQGKVISVHDVILQAIEEHLGRRGR